MFDNLAEIEVKFINLEQQLMQGGLSGKELSKISIERSGLEEIVIKYRAYKVAKKDLDEAEEMLRGSDSEMAALAKEEVTELNKIIEGLTSELTILSLPTDPLDEKNVLLEIRAGTGGEESALFASDLMRMYLRFAERYGWKTEMMSLSVSSTGEGYKEAICQIRGDRVYSKLKFESGVHRVQRVPTTESQGRVHTSAVTVAVLPEAEDIDIEINPVDLDIASFRASGAGGQHVNTTDSAVRIVHKPTGLVVECQDERSQHKNKDKAMKVLKTRLFEQAHKEQHDKRSADRKSQVGSGDRSERIRTYNFPQGRMTDHRIGLTLYKLADIMDGSIIEVLDALGAHHQTELLKQSN